MTQPLDNIARYDDSGGIEISRQLSGRLLWVLPDGKIWELTEYVNPGMPGTCEECDDSVDVMAVVREHRPCGYVTADGFNLTIEPGEQCPKCDEQITSLEPMPQVGSVRICGSCGKLSDRTRTDSN